MAISLIEIPPALKFLCIRYGWEIPLWSQCNLCKKTSCYYWSNTLSTKESPLATLFLNPMKSASVMTLQIFRKIYDDIPSLPFSSPLVGPGPPYRITHTVEKIYWSKSCILLMRSYEIILLSQDTNLWDRCFCCGYVKLYLPSWCR